MLRWQTMDALNKPRITRTATKLALSCYRCQRSSSTTKHGYSGCQHRRRLRRALGARAPHFYNWLGTGAPWVEEQQTRNWPNCTYHDESAHWNDYCTCRAKKVEGHDKKFPALYAGRSPPPHFKFAPAPLAVNRVAWLNMRQSNRLINCRLLGKIDWFLEPRASIAECHFHAGNTIVWVVFSIQPLLPFFLFKGHVSQYWCYSCLTKSGMLSCSKTGWWTDNGCRRHRRRRMQRLSAVQ